MRYIIAICMFFTIISIARGQFTNPDCVGAENVPEFFIVDRVVNDDDTNVCFSIQVNNFENVGSFQFILAWDPTILEFVGPSIDNSALTQPIFVNDASGDDGLIFLIWSQFDASETLADGTSIVEICFDVIGDPGEESDFQLIGGFNIPEPQVQYAIDDNIPNDSGCLFNYPNHDIGNVEIVCDVIFSQIQQCHTTSNTGSITLNPCSPDPPFTFTVSPGAVSGNIPDGGLEVIDNLSPGIYTVTIMDNAGGSFVEMVEIENKPELSINVDDIMNPSCANFNNGFISLEATGGESFGIFGYEFEWSNGQFTPEIIQLPSEIFSVTVSDLNGCSTTADFDLTVSEIVIDVISTNNDVCGGGVGSIDFAISGGTPDANGEYDVTIFQVPFVGFTDGFLLDNLEGGTYVIDVEDSVGCSDEVEVIVGGEEMEFTSMGTSTDISCFGECDGSFSVTIDDLGPFIFEPVINQMNGQPLDVFITDNSISSANLCPGTYQIIAANANNTCPYDTMITIVEPAPLTITSMTFPDESCVIDNGSVFFEVQGGSGGELYTWDPVEFGMNTTSNVIFEAAPAGIYAVTVTDINGCTIASVAEVMMSNEAGEAEIDVLAGLGCNGSTQGELEATVVGDDIANYDIIWNNLDTNSQHDTGLTTLVDEGEYELVITNVISGCEARDTVDLVPTNDLTFEVRGSDLMCHEGGDGVIEIFNVTGGNGVYSVEWDGHPTISDLTLTVANAGTTNFIVMDELGCSLAGTFTLDQPLDISTDIDFPTYTFPTCFGSEDGMITVFSSGGTATNGYSFDWSIDAFDESGVTTSTASGFGDGEFDVMITDDNGCTDTLTFVMEEPDEINIDFNESLIISPDCVGTCDGIVELVFEGGTPDPGLVPYDIIWEDGNQSTTREGLCPDLFRITITDDNGCMKEDSIDFRLTGDTLNLFIDTIRTRPLSCGGEPDAEIAVFAEGGIGDIDNYFYQWTDNVSFGTVAENLEAGDYVITVTDEGGCTATTSFTVTDGPMLNIDLFDFPMVPCAGDSVCLIPGIPSGGAGPPYSYQLGAGNQVLPIDSCITLFAGTYDLIVFDGQLDCRLDTTIQVFEPTITSVDIGDNLEVMLGETDMFIEADYVGDFQLDSIVWTATDTVNCLDLECQDVQIDFTQDQTISVIATDVNGCIAVDQILVTVDNVRNVFLPTIFAPTVETERTFMVHLGQGAELINYLLVYDRWGNEVYRVEDVPADETTLHGWTGRFGNLDANEGVYVYIVEVVFSDGVVQRFTRDVTLLR